MRVKVEICMTTMAEALAARDAGADSVEVCSWLACGGLTPGAGLVNLVRERLQGSPLRRRVLVRPSPGGFHYASDERDMIVRDTLLLAVADNEAGAVAGALHSDGLLDLELMRRVKEALNGRELTVHRAIDHASEMLAAVDQCIELGADRVLTSGGETLAGDGVAMLKKMVARAGKQLVIAAGGGINPSNVVRIVEETGVREVHFSAQKPTGTIGPGAAMSAAHAGVNFEVEPDLAKIEGVMNALTKAGLR